MPSNKVNITHHRISAALQWLEDGPVCGCVCWLLCDRIPEHKLITSIFQSLFFHFSRRVFMKKDDMIAYAWGDRGLRRAGGGGAACAWLRACSAQPQRWLDEVSKLSAMDVLARASMKDAAKCDTHCELQISVNHQISERIWRCWDSPAARLFQCLLTPQSTSSHSGIINNTPYMDIMMDRSSNFVLRLLFCSFWCLSLNCDGIVWASCILCSSSEDMLCVGRVCLSLSHLLALYMRGCCVGPEYKHTGGHVRCFVILSSERDTVVSFFYLYPMLLFYLWRARYKWTVVGRSDSGPATIGPLMTT